MPQTTIDPIVARIEANPKYQELKRRRNAFGWTMTLAILIAYYGFIGLIAFDKELLATPIGSGVTTLGIPIAIGVIALTIVLTAIYVHRANNQYDRITAEILQEASE